MIDFFLPMKPPTTTHQQKKVRVVKGKPVFYEPDSLVAARSKLMGHLYPHAPEHPLNGPIRVEIMWLYEAKGKYKIGDYKTTKPDLDNVEKLLFDCMTDLGFWKDDAHIASRESEKKYNDIPGVYMRIGEI